MAMRNPLQRLVPLRKTGGRGKTEVDAVAVAVAVDAACSADQAADRVAADRVAADRVAVDRVAAG
jgi:hypothetical protein